MTFDVSRSRGFTLVELIVVIAILSLVTGALVMIVYQLLTIPRWGNDQLAVDSDLRNAGLWLVRDGNQSASFTSTGACGVFAVPTVADTRYITYTYASGTNTLNRQSSTGQTIGVARRVVTPVCSLGAMTGTVVISLTATSGDVSASQVYTVTLRVR